MKKIYKISVITIIIYLLFHLIMFLYQTNQILNNSVPFDYKKVLNNDKNEFIIDVDIECNRYFNREIGIIFEPDYKYSNNTIFKYDYNIIEDDKILKQGSSNKNTLHGNVKRVVLLNYKPSNPLFCDKQKINIKLYKNKENIDFSNHKLYFYISKPRSL